MPKLNMNIIPAKKYTALTLKAGQFLSLIDLKGGQVADLTAFRLHDSSEWLSNGRSFDYGGTLYFTTGDTLFSNKSNPMLSIVADDVGRHDFLYAACSKEMYRIQYGNGENQANCLDNLQNALKETGLNPVVIPTPFNAFMNVEILPDGALTINPPRSKKGDRILFRAEMELTVAISACPAGLCNGGSQKPIGYEIVDDISILNPSRQDRLE
jgi:uncharacterized protein YcgI (DUF1989 family)